VSFAARNRWGHAASRGGRCQFKKSGMEAHTETRRRGGRMEKLEDGKRDGITIEAMPVGLCSATAPSRSDARRAPVKGDGVVCSVRGSRLDRPACSLPPGWVMQCPASLGAGAPTLRGVSLLVADAWGGLERRLTPCRRIEMGTSRRRSLPGWVPGRHPEAQGSVPPTGLQVRGCVG